jgi:hypothetical protein
MLAKLFITASILAAVVGCQAAPTPTPETTTETAPDTTATETAEPASETVVTKADYDAISEGMSLSEVEELIGPGEEMSSTEFEGITTTTVMWSNPDFSNLVLTIQNGEVVSKAQSMLE